MDHDPAQTPSSAGIDAEAGSPPLADVPIPQLDLKAIRPLDPPPRPREYLALILAVIVFDVALYPTVGHASWGCLLAILPIVLALGSAGRRPDGAVWLMSGLLGLEAARSFWMGSVLGGAVGLALAIALTMTLNGCRPFVLEGIAYGAQAIGSGIVNLIGYGRCSHLSRIQLRRSVMAPIATLAVFSLLFVLANPNFREWCDEAFDAFVEWFSRMPVTPWRVLLWGGALWAVAGLLRPCIARRLREALEADAEAAGSPTLKDAGLAHATARNTLATVVVLFAAYLIYEVIYLVVREIPQGFYYSGYAHAGAFWLTVALAFSTFTLGLAMRGGVLAHEEARILKRLTWIWTVENLVLAACVFHRLQIYVDYNGLSRMRMVGTFGVAAVAIGFVLAVHKVLAERSLLWLIRRNLWALFLVIYVWTLTPVDWIVTRYNVGQILAGNLAPSVQIGWHRIGPEGIPVLLPLVDCDNEFIREGVRALLAGEEIRLGVLRHEDWKNRQWAEAVALRRLQAHNAAWSDVEPTRLPLERASGRRSRVEVTGQSLAEATDGEFERMKQYTRQWYD
jgi:hypothetical protein